VRVLAHRWLAQKKGFHFTCPVDSFAEGVSHYGCYQMAGNVMEWCDGTFSVRGKTCVVYRGGSFYFAWRWIKPNEDYSANMKGQSIREHLRIDPCRHDDLSLKKSPPGWPEHLIRKSPIP
jgi:formylglycine-generating enzyme required for sulfatase activity